MEDFYAEVLVDVASRVTDQVFYYAVPSSLAGRLTVGSRVLIPFNRRIIAGYVTGFNPAPDYLREKLEFKEIMDILDEGPVFTPAQLELARWMAGYYLYPVVSALNAIIFPRIQGTLPKKVMGIFPKIADGKKPIFEGRGSSKRESVWSAALAHPGMSRKELSAAAGTSVSLVDKLISEGLLWYSEREQRRDPYPDDCILHQESVVLTTEQKDALGEIISALEESKREVFLLYGITGSGKTEIYLRAISHALDRGKQAVVMVPEISLTPQMISSFKGRFGDRVAVLHSRLSEGERYDEWRRIDSGAAQVVLGARSAVFAPLTGLGLVIMDEEHESSYKQEDTPRYHARDVALWLAGKFEAVAVLGSATPAIESYCRAKQGGPYRLLKLTKRVEMRPMPKVRIIDMREEMKSGNIGIFSRELVSAVEVRLARGEQVILFLNRRGYATFVVCRECGLVMKCPDCDISLTYHAGGFLRCHYCNYTVSIRGRCSDCGSGYLGYFGTGTQRVEEDVRSLFPDARVMRMDRDTTAKKGSHKRILKAFKDGGADILIGTQMVAKGLDMPQVTLVGVINADVTLYMPEFRSAERTFQLVTQVAGRAGRGDLGGEVLIQTLSPGHYSIVSAANHDYSGFFLQEMRIRKTLKYPPFMRMARVMITGSDEDEVKTLADKWASLMAASSEGEAAIDILGPAPAPLTRVKGRYRYHIVIKAASGNRLRCLLQSVATRAEMKSKSGAKVVMDIDPQSMM